MGVIVDSFSKARHFVVDAAALMIHYRTGVPQEVISVLISNFWAFFSLVSAAGFFSLASYSQLNEQMERVNQEKPRRTAWLRPIHPLGNPGSCGINAFANTLRILFTGKSLFECQMGYLTEQNLDVWVLAAVGSRGSC